ncbi:pantetheine-phosphate adenylyltransferase [Cyanothece sp. BG0011]|uniref:pantetheine-phosphate adenylyltransferase n=1 Tax=Cyanothece sp. BG0011 TaxID=2082950 RepID=UPI000D1F819D|nr:pantetheine-phosphate adenylyltransferase [Cyanothece sp. BG0011]
MIALYPGSFDPITLGHLDIIERGVLLFEKVIVTVMYNPNKQPLFSVEKRVEQIIECTQHLPRVEVDSYRGLTVDYAKLRKAQVLLRGLRVLSDFEKELQMAHTNKTLSKEVQTVFLATNNEYSFLSSSTVKEIAQFGGSIAHMVPENVLRDLQEYYQKKNERHKL